MYVSCKQIMSYFLSLKYVNIDFGFNFDRSPRTLTENNRSVESQAIWKVRRQKRKSVIIQRSVYSVSVTQLGCDVDPASPVSVSLACFPLKLVLPGKIPSVWPWPLRRGVTRAPLKIQLCPPLFTVSVFVVVVFSFFCLFSFPFSFFSFLLSHACFLPLTFFFLVADCCLTMTLKIQALVYDRLPLEEDARKQCSECGWLSDLVVPMGCRWSPAPVVFGIAGSLFVGRLVLGSLALVPGVGGSLVLEIWGFPCCPTLPCGSHTETASQTHSSKGKMS